jgi:glycosyltransferase involved in cell wall biosynthesis
VQDVIRHGENGLLVDFFDGDALATTVAAVLADPSAHRPLGAAARKSVIERFDLHTVCLPQLLQLVDRVAAGA